MCVVYIPSRRPEVAAGVQDCLGEFPSEHFDGHGYSSFAKLANTIIATSPHETIIIASTKVAPSAGDAQRVLDFLEQGFGFVGLFRFGFFGFKKDLIREIGFFDERYLGGGCEDADFLLRIREADIAIVEEESVVYHEGPSGWTHEAAFAHHKKKWKIEGEFYCMTKERLLPEETYGYDLGPSQGTEFLPFEKSQMLEITRKWLP